MKPSKRLLLSMMQTNGDKLLRDLEANFCTNPWAGLQEDRIKTAFLRKDQSQGEMGVIIRSVLLKLLYITFI